MSHAFKTASHPEWSATYNSDLSGKARIVGPNGISHIDCMFLVELVAEFVRAKKISELESASTRELLGVDL